MQAFATAHGANATAVATVRSASRACPYCPKLLHLHNLHTDALPMDAISSICGWLYVLMLTATMQVMQE